MSDDKYIVFRREDWDKWINENSEILTSLLDQSAQASGYAEDPRGYPQPLADAVVIRRQDYFAGPALHTYSSMIAIAVKLATPGETRDRLRKVADYFHDQAVLAEAEGYKVPD